MAKKSPLKTRNGSRTELRHRIWLVFLIAVVARLAAALVLNMTLDRLPDRNYLIEGDADGYWILAQKIVAGEDFALYEPLRYVMRMPGFSAVLAVSISIFGESLYAARFFLAVLTSFAVFPAYWLGIRAKNNSTGIIAALLIALMPAYVGFSVAILSECLFATFIIWNVWAFARWVETEDSWVNVLGWGAVSGLIAAIAVYIRPSWLLLPPAVVPVVLLWGKSTLSKRLVSSGVMLLCLVGALLPWGVRNQNVTGHFVLTTLWMGPSLYDGLHPGATGDSDMTFFEQEHVNDRLSEYEVNQHYKDRAVQFAKENPWRAFELSLIKLIRYWNLWPNAAQFQNPALVITLAVSNLFLFIGAGWGIWVSRNQLWLVILCILPILYFAALHTLFVSSLRYRLPAEYPLIVMTAVGWQAIFLHFIKHETRMDMDED